MENVNMFGVVDKTEQLNIICCHACLGTADEMRLIVESLDACNINLLCADSVCSYSMDIVPVSKH